jgi:hypothetical protein
VHSSRTFTINFPDRRRKKAMERCHSNERLLDERTKTSILGRTVYKESVGCDQKQKFRNEKGSETSWCFVWNALWTLQRNLWVSQASVSVRGEFSVLLKIRSTLNFHRGPPGSYAMVSRMREMWPGNGDDQNDLLSLVQRNRMSMVSRMQEQV